MNLITWAYALGLAALLVMVDFGALRDIALYVNHTFLLDKAVHFAMFGVLALLANATLLHRFRPRAVAAIATGSIIVLVLSTLEEISNSLVAFRTYSLGDLTANYLGIICLGILPLLAWQRSQTEMRRAA
jgi:VanZ family protein